MLDTIGSKWIKAKGHSSRSDNDIYSAKNGELLANSVTNGQRENL